MRCPDCRKQYSVFEASPDAFRPARELVCPQCNASLSVGWWPMVGIALVAVVCAFAVAMSLSLGIGDWVVEALGVSHRKVMSKLIRAAVTAAMGVAPIAPGMYAIWVFGWYARSASRRGA